MTRLKGLEGSASLRFEATVDFCDLASHLGLILSQLDRLEVEDVTILDFALIQRYLTHQLGLVTIPLDQRLLQSPGKLLRRSLVDVQSEICTIAVLESLATQCFWSGQSITRVGDILFNRNPFSLRVTDGFAKFNQLDLNSPSWCVESMTLTLGWGAESILAGSIRMIAEEEAGADLVVENFEMVMTMRELNVSLEVQCERLLKSYASVVTRR